VYLPCNIWVTKNNCVKRIRDMSVINFKFANDEAANMLVASLDKAEVCLKFGEIHEGVAEVTLAVMIDGQEVCYGDNIIRVFPNSTLMVPGKTIALEIAT
jgi:hypothetical protein